MTQLQKIKAKLHALIGDVQDAMVTATGQNAFYLQGIHDDLVWMRDRDFALIPVDNPQAREEALDNDPRVRAFTKEKAS